MKLNFEKSGQGPPLIVLHGLFGSLDNWRAMSKTLSDGVQVIAVDQRNHGRSPHNPAMSYAAMAEDLRELVDELGLDRVSLLGHSMGGKTAMEFALSHPERVEKLMVVDIGPGDYPPLHRELIDAMLALDLAAFQTRAQIEAALAPSVRDRAVRQFVLKSVAREAGGPFAWRINLPAIEQNYDLLRADLPAGRTCDQPALFLRGAESDFLPNEELRSIRELFPTAELITVPGAGHWVHVEAPLAFRDAVVAFMRRVRPCR